jgi:hypothetical protein
LGDVPTPRTIFSQFVQKYVTGVPKIVISEAQSFEDAMPAGNVYLEVFRAVNPEAYRRLEEAVGELRARRRRIICVHKTLKVGV